MGRWAGLVFKLGMEGGWHDSSSVEGGSGGQGGWRGLLAVSKVAMVKVVGRGFSTEELVGFLY